MNIQTPILEPIRIRVSHYCVIVSSILIGCPILAVLCQTLAMLSFLSASMLLAFALKKGKLSK